MSNPSSLTANIVGGTAAEKEGITVAITNRKQEICRVFVVLFEARDFGTFGKNSIKVLTLFLFCSRHLVFNAPWCCRGEGLVLEEEDIWDQAVLLCHGRSSRGRQHRAWARK